MASIYIGLNRGAPNLQPENLAVGTSTNSTDMELRYDETKALTREDVMNFLDTARVYLLAGNISQTGIAL